jgi:DNA-binding IclR family transcriptional regulator
MPSNKLVQSVTRSLMILEQLASVDEGMTLQQLCQALDLKPPTMHNLLRTLVARGYVERLSSPARYRLGATMFDLVDQYRNLSVQHYAAKAVSNVFARFSNIRVTYCEEVAGDVVLKLRMTPERPGVLERPWHAVMLAYTSASVLVFQAFWRGDQQYSYEQRYPFELYGQHIWETPERAKVFLEDVRQRGYAAPPVNKAGLFRAAVPVFTPNGHTITGALGAAFTVQDVPDPDNMKHAVIDCLQDTAHQFVTSH